MSVKEYRLLQRELVTSTLRAAIERHPLVVLTAPMGYGKTTAAKALIRDLHYRFFYITIDPGQHNAQYLWNRACDQLSSQGSGIGKILQRMGFPADDVQLRRTLDQGRNYLGGRPTLLVLDDYHFSKDPQVDRLIEAMIRECIPGLRILLLSRTRPSMPLEELRMKGLAEHIKRNILTFSEREAAEFFAMNGVSDSRMASEAWNMSEGWAAALWLSLQSCQSSAQLIPIGDLDQLVRGVFSKYSEQDQSILLKLSCLDSFTPRQAALVTGDEEAPRRLTYLQEHNALIAYEPAFDTYRMHSIFRTYLKNRLEENLQQAARKIDLPEVYRRAAEWYLKADDILQALRFLFRAGSDDDLLRFLEIGAIPSDGTCMLFDPEGIRQMLQALPWRLIHKCPLGWLSFVYHYMSRVDLQEGGKMLAEAEARLGAEPSITEEMRGRIQGEIELIKGIIDFNDLFAMRDRYDKAHRLFNGGTSSISHRHLIWTFGSPHVSFMYLREPGSYADLIRLVEENLFQYQEMTNGCSAGAQDLFRAEYLLETGAFRQVKPCLMKSLYRADSKEQLSTAIAIRFSQARLLMATGQKQRLFESVNELSEAVHRAGSPLLSNSLDLCRGYLYAAGGLCREVPGWLREGNFKAVRQFYQTNIFAHIVHGKCLLDSGEWHKLEALAQDIPALVGKYANLFALLHGQVLLAIAQHNNMEREKARESLLRAIELARPDGIILSIAEYGEHISSMLRKLHREMPGDRLIGSIFRISNRFSAPVKNEHKLTPREREILARAIGGMPNQDIAAELKVKLVTVGNTLTRVYRKLGVQNRVEAANIWRELNGG